jgi:hypothetical protein
MTPGYRKMPVIAHLKELFTQKLQKTVQIGLPILNPNFSEIALFKVNLGKVEIAKFNS